MTFLKHFDKRDLISKDKGPKKVKLRRLVFVNIVNDPFRKEQLA